MSFTRHPLSSARSSSTPDHSQQPCAARPCQAKLSVVTKTVESRAESAPRGQKVPDPLRSLAQRAASGDERATHALVMELGSSMLRTVRKVLGAHHPDVEDVTQDAVLGMLKSLERFRGECTVVHYANQVALRRALHARRHFTVRDRVGDLSGEVDDPKDERQDIITPLDAVVARERRRVVRGLLGQLSEPIAESLAMHFMLGYTVEEIATLLELSSNTIWSRLKLGKRALRRALAQDRRLAELALGGEVS